MSLGQGAASVVGMIVIVGLVVADVILANDKTSQNTPSEIIRWVSRYTAVVPFGLGVLMGHWFHPDDDFDAIFGANSPRILAIIGGLILVGGAVLGWRKQRLAAWPWAVAGTVLGALLWPV